jgi:adenylate kinase family enzyme
LNRICITGNSGSGNSYLGERIAKSLEVTSLDLDTIFWQKGAYTEKRDKTELNNLLLESCCQTKWVVEGIYGELISSALKFADVFIWVNPDWKTCKSNLISRKRDTPPSLYEYSETYWSRKCKRSHEFHELIYSQFEGEKYCFTSNEQVNEFITSLSVV